MWRASRLVAEKKLSSVFFFKDAKQCVKGRQKLLKMVRETEENKGGGLNKTESSHCKNWEDTCTSTVCAIYKTQGVNPGFTSCFHEVTITTNMPAHREEHVFCIFYTSHSAVFYCTHKNLCVHSCKFYTNSPSAQSLHITELTQLKSFPSIKLDFCLGLKQTILFVRQSLNYILN